MRIKMLSDAKIEEVDLKSGTIATVDDDNAKIVIEAKQAIEYTKEIEEAEKKALQVELENKIEKEKSKKEINMTIEVKTEDRPKFKNMGEFLSAVVKADRDGVIDSRLCKSTGQNETTPADGGYTVSVDIAGYITQQAQAASVIAEKCSKMEIGSLYTGIKIPQVNESARSVTSLYGGVRVYSPGEGVAKTAFKQAYTQKQIDLKKLCAVNYVTDELLQDNAALNSFIRMNVGKAIAWTKDNEILNGTLSAATAIKNNAATAEVTVTGDHPTAAEIAKMYATNLNRTRAEWFMSTDQYAELIALATTGTFPLFQPNYTVAPNGMLLGRPINVIEQASTAADETAFMFLDLSDYLVIGKGGIDEAVSIHVKFLEDETAFRWTTRFGGAPLMASTVTLPDNSVVSSLVTRD